MSRVIRSPNEDCDLHQALINTGYEVRRENYYLKGKYTGKVKDFYAPVYDPNELIPGCVRDWANEPRYRLGEDGNAYPYSYGMW
jgi:hypothetical protein